MLKSNRENYKQTKNFNIHIALLAVALFLPTLFIPHETASANLKDANVTYNYIAKKIVIDRKEELRRHRNYNRHL